MANASRIQPRSWLSAVTVATSVAGLAAATVGFTTNWTHRPRPIQKPPYVEHAVAPRTAGGMGHPVGILGRKQEGGEGEGGKAERGRVGDAGNGGRSGRAGLDC